LAHSPLLGTLLARNQPFLDRPIDATLMAVFYEGNGEGNQFGIQLNRSTQ